MTENNHNNNNFASDYEESRRVWSSQLSHDLSTMIPVDCHRCVKKKEEVGERHALSHLFMHCTQWLHVSEKRKIVVASCSRSPVIISSCRAEKDFNVSVFSSLDCPNGAKVKEIITRHLHNHRQGRQIKRGDGQFNARFLHLHSINRRKYQRLPHRVKRVIIILGERRKNICSLDATSFCFQNLCVTRKKSFIFLTHQMQL